MGLTRPYILLRNCGLCRCDAKSDQFRYIKIHTWLRGLGEQNKRNHFEAQLNEKYISFVLFPLTSEFGMTFKISKMAYFIHIVNHNNNNNNNNNNIQLESFTRIRRRIWGFLVEKLIFVLLTEINVWFILEINPTQETAHCCWNRPFSEYDKNPSL